MANETPVLCDLNKLKSKDLTNPLFDKFTLDLAEKIWKFHQTIPEYEPTPLANSQNLFGSFTV